MSTFLSFVFFIFWTVAAIKTGVWLGWHERGIVEGERRNAETAQRLNQLREEAPRVC